jgi:hypothetical protein
MSDCDVCHEFDGAHSLSWHVDGVADAVEAATIPRRERIASQVLAGLANVAVAERWTPESTASFAVDMTDALIERLKR